MSSPLAFAVLMGSLGVGVGSLGGCTATGVTLRSNHYRVFVPPGWQVVEAGGDAQLPTLLRVPSQDGAPAVEVRLYPWLVDGPTADAAGEALKHLAATDVLGLTTSRADDACAERADELQVFGKPSRAVHAQNQAGQRMVITAGEAYGSLVAVVGIAAPGSSCAGVEAIDRAVKRVVETLAGNPDPLRVRPQPLLLEDARGRPVDVPAHPPPMP